jgi:L-ascorbate metabolism protein UlaG (beta-lactamase superfamily)
MKKILTQLSTIILVFSFIACDSSKKIENTSEDITDTISETTMIQSDRYLTKNGELKVTLIGHGSLMFEYGGKTIHIDPFSEIADYTKLPKADLVVLTHEHYDHLDTLALESIKKENSKFIMTPTCQEILGYGDTISNDGKVMYDNIDIQAVPAYNIVHKNTDGKFYHPKGKGNGYIFTFSDYKVYVAGDTENIPEMDSLKNTISIAFLPKNIPYTMDDKMFVDAAKKVSPTYLYPYHFEKFDYNKISKDLAETKIKLLVRAMSNK